MIILKNCEFVKNSNAPIISSTFSNAAGDILSLQISGASGLFHIEGRNHRNGDWVPLAGISLTNFAVTREGFTQSGMYEIGIGGVRELRARVESVDGSVTIFGQIISTGET